MMNLYVRFILKITIDFHTGCWEWCAGKNDDGYGYIAVENQSLRAHRVSWELFKGKIPEDLHVLHHCDNPGCVNPDHLFIGYNADNMLDKTIKGRQHLGVNRFGAKLTELQVLEIRNMNNISHSIIAEKFGVSKQTIGRIMRREKWKHI